MENECDNNPWCRNSKEYQDTTTSHILREIWKKTKNQETLFSRPSGRIHYVNLAINWGTICTFHRVGPPTPKRDGSLSGGALLGAAARHLNCLQAPFFRELPTELIWGD